MPRRSFVLLGLIVTMAVVGFAAPAFADSAPLYPLPEGPTVAPPANVPVAVAPVQTVHAAPSAQSGVGGLPVTGGDVAQLALLGVAFVGLGVVLLRFRAKRRLIV